MQSGKTFPFMRIMFLLILLLSKASLSACILRGLRPATDDQGKRTLVPTGEPLVFMECDEVLIAVGQLNAFPWIEEDVGIEFDEWGLPVLKEGTFQSSLEHVFFWR